MPKAHKVHKVYRALTALTVLLVSVVPLALLVAVVSEALRGLQEHLAPPARPASKGPRALPEPRARLVAQVNRAQREPPAHRVTRGR